MIRGEQGSQNIRQERLSRFTCLAPPAYPCSSRGYPCFRQEFGGTSGATPVVVGIAATEKQEELPNASAGLLLSRLLHEGRDTSASTQTGLGLLDADYFFQFIGNEAGYEGDLTDDSYPTGIKAYTFYVQSGGVNKLVITLWWPERRGTINGKYYPSDLDVRVYDANQVLVSGSQGTSSNGVFERVVIPNPVAGQTYTIKVTGYHVDTIADPAPPDVADKQHYFLWISPLVNHS